MSIIILVSSCNTGDLTPHSHLFTGTDPNSPLEDMKQRSKSQPTDLYNPTNSNNKTTHYNGSAKYIPISLSNLENVRVFVDESAIIKYPPIASLVLKARIQKVGPVALTDDGVETTFAVKHL